MFEEVLGYVPPWYRGNLTNMYNQVFNMTPQEDQQIKNMFRKVSPKFHPKYCKTPCTETMFETQFLVKEPSFDPVIQLTFGHVVSVTRSSFSISPETLVGRLGGSVSSGRTLLWGLITGGAGDWYH